MVSAKNSTGQEYELTPAGPHPATCIWVIDLGYQYSERYKTTKPRILLGFELPGERIEYEGENRARVISRQFTLSLHENSTLRPFLEMWRGRSFSESELDPNGKGFDVNTVAGAPALLTVIHAPKESGGTTAKIGGVTRLPKEFPKPPGPENEITVFDQGQPIPEHLPDWIKNEIKKALLEVRESIDPEDPEQARTPAAEMVEDNLPF